MTLRSKNIFMGSWGKFIVYGLGTDEKIGWVKLVNNNNSSFINTQKDTNTFCYIDKKLQMRVKATCDNHKGYKTGGL